MSFKQEYLNSTKRCGGWSPAVHELALAKISGNAIKVFFFLLSQRSDFHHSIRKIAEAVSMAENTVDRAIKKLIRAGMIAALPAENDPQKHWYRLEPPEAWTVSIVSGFGVEPGNRLKICVGDASKSEAEASQILGHIQEDREETKVGVSSSSSKEKSSSWGEEAKSEFDSIFENYPNKIGTRVARKKYDEQVKTPEDIVRIRRAVENCLRKCSGSSVRYAPKISKFMEEWEDWAVIEVPRSTQNPTITVADTAGWDSVRENLESQNFQGREAS